MASQALKLARELMSRPKLLQHRGYRITTWDDTMEHRYDFVSCQDEMSILTVMESCAFFLTAKGELAVMPCPNGTIQRYSWQHVERFLKGAKDVPSELLPSCLTGTNSRDLEESLRGGFREATRDTSTVGIYPPYLTDEAELRRVNIFDGRICWTYRLDGDRISAILSDTTWVQSSEGEIEVDVVFVGTERGRVFWLDSQTGVELGRIQFPGRISRIAWPEFAGLFVETVSPLL